VTPALAALSVAVRAAGSNGGNDEDGSGHRREARWRPQCCRRGHLLTWLPQTMKISGLVKEATAVEKSGGNEWVEHG